MLICQFQLDTKFQARVLSWFSRFAAVSPKRAVFSSSFLVLLVYRRIIKPSFENVHHNASVLRGFLHPLTPSLPSEIHTSVSLSCLSVHCLLVSLLNAEPLLGLPFPGLQEPPSSPSLKASSTMQIMTAITIKWHPQAHRTSKKCFKKV